MDVYSVPACVSKVTRAEFLFDILKAYQVQENVYVEELLKQLDNTDVNSLPNIYQKNYEALLNIDPEVQLI